MIDWLVGLISPLIGAGASPLFWRVFGDKKKAAREPKARGLAAINEQLTEMEEWQEDADRALQGHQRDLRRLGRELRAMRLLLLVTVLLLLAVELVRQFGDKT